MRGLHLRSATALHRRVALSAHEAWAHWAAGALGAQLLSAMQGDPALVSHIPLRNWAETVVSHVSMQPEAACVALLTCQAKSGAHVMQCHVLRSLGEESGACVCRSRLCQACLDG